MITQVNVVYIGSNTIFAFLNQVGQFVTVYKSIFSHTVEYDTLVSHGLKLTFNIMANKASSTSYNISHYIIPKVVL